MTTQPEHFIIIEADGTVHYAQPYEANIVEKRGAIVVPAEEYELSIRDDLNLLYEETLAAQAKEFFADGRGILYSAVISLTVVTALFINTFTTAIQSLIQMVIGVWVSTLSANLALILVGVCGLLYLWAGGKSKGRVLVLKGCPRGPTPGHHTIRVS